MRRSIHKRKDLFGDDAQRPHRKSIFGSGFLVSDNIAEQTKQEATDADADTIYWQLSEREKRIVQKLNQPK